MHGPREFFLHLFTITIGLLIALSLEGLVEWQHHRHLVHDAEISLRLEIQNNAKGMQETLDELHKQQAALKKDITVLDYIVKNGKAPDNSGMEVTFHIRTFDDVSWKTAQSTGALGYMPYDHAQQYAEIYNAQAELADSERVGARDAIIALAPFLDSDEETKEPTNGEAKASRDKIETLQGQLLLVDSFMSSLDRHYKAFLAVRPGE